jgi:hypothetical protein
VPFPSGALGRSDVLNLLLWSLVFAFSTSLFSFTFSLGGIARTFENLSVLHVQRSISATSNEASNILPYFIENILKNTVQAYLEKNLEGYLVKPTWSVSFLFSSYQSSVVSLNGEKTPLFPQRVTIGFSCDYSVQYHYENSRSFYIKKGDWNGK